MALSNFPPLQCCAYAERAGGRAYDTCTTTAARGQFNLGEYGLGAIEYTKTPGSSWPLAVSTHVLACAWLDGRTDERTDGALQITHGARICLCWRPRAAGAVFSFLHVPQWTGTAEERRKEGYIMYDCDCAQCSASVSKRGGGGSG